MFGKCQGGSGECFVTQVLRGWRECSNAYVIAEHENCCSRLRAGGGRGHDDKSDEGRKLSTCGRW